MRGKDMYNFKFLDGPKYFRRTFWMYFFAMVVILISVGIIIINTYSNTNQYEESLSIVTKLKESSNNIDDSIKVANVLCQLIQSYDVVEEFAKEKTDNYKNIDFNRVTGIARLIAGHESEFLNSNMRIALKRADDDIVISMGNTMSSKECIERTGVDFNQISEVFAGYKASGFYSEIINSTYENTMQLIAKKIYDGGSVIYFGVSFYVDGATIYYDEVTDKVVVHINKNGDSKIELKASDIDSMSSNEIKKIQHGRNHTSLLTGSVNYGNVLYIEDFYKEGRGDRVAIVILSGILCLIAMYVLSLFLAKKTYVPIREIVENIGATLSNEDDETEVVNAHIAKIQDENGALKSVAAGQRRLLRNRILDEILNGFLRVTDSELAQYKLSFVKKECIVALIDCYAVEAIHFINMSDEQMTLSACIVKWLSEKIKDDETVVYAVSDRRILYISSNTDRDANKILSLTNEARQVFDVNLTVAMGEWVQGMKKLQDMYLALESGMNSRQIIKGRDIIMLEEIKSSKQSAGYYPLSLEMELLDFVKNGEDAKALNRLERMFCYNEADTGEGFEEFKNLVSVTIRIY